MIYITVELNKDIYIKIPKVKEGISPYTLTMTSQAGGQQMVFADLVNNSDKSSVFRFTLNFTQYTPSGIYNYILTDTADKQISKGLVQVNMTDSEDYFYQDDELGYFVEDEGGGGDMSNYYTKSQIDSMLTQYEKKSDLPDFNNFVTLDQLSSQSYVTSEEMQTEVESYINSKDLINSTQLANTLEWYVTLNELQNMSYATESYVMEKISQIPGGGISMDDVKDYVVSQSYVTSDYLNNVGYITTENVRDNYYNNVEIQEILTSYLTKEELSGMGYATTSDIPTVNDATVTIKQGGDVMGSFTLNQVNNVEILLNEGGQGGGVTMNDVKQYVDSQSYVTSTTLNNIGYVTTADLTTAGYITGADLNLMAYITLNDIPVVDLSSYVTYTYLEERISQIPGGGISMDEVKDYVVSQSYVTSNELSNTGYVTSEYLSNQAYITPSVLNAQAYITLNDVPVVDLSSYVTYTYLEERLSEYQPSVDLSAYVTKTELENCSYVTKNALEGNYYSKTDINAMGYITINDVPGVDLSAYVKYSDLNNYGYITAQDIVNQSYITPSVLNAQSYITATQLNACGYATVSQIPVVSNAGVVIKQGGVTKGSFNLNQSSGVTIDLDGESVDLSSYVTKSELVEQSYITSNVLTDYATKSYVQEKINEIPVVDLSSYVSKQDLSNMSYATKSFISTNYIDNSELSSMGYITSAELSTQAYLKANQLETITLIFTLSDDSTRTVVAYTQNYVTA